MKKPIFVDTNVLCAIYNVEDSLHIKRSYIKSILTQYNPVLSNFILLETYTILSQRISKKFAIAFGERIRQKHPYTLFWIDRNIEDDVWDIFCSIKEKNFSYVDASIIAVMKRRRIAHLLTFDRSFKSLEEKFSFTIIGD